MSYNPFVLNINRYSITSNYLSLKIALILFLFSLILGTFGFKLIEGYTLLEGFYMAVITISTVGYTEVRSLNPGGQLFSSIYIIFNIGIFAYTLGSFTKYVIHGEIFKSMHLKMIQKKVSELKNHVIICGYGRYGKEISRRFIRHNIDFVIIEYNETTIEDLQNSPDKVLYVHGDATQDDILKQAGINACQAIITVMDDDANNLFTVLSARQLNATAIIISRAKEATSEDKLRLAGANHTIMPEHIGGFYIANLINKPDTVEFFNYIAEQTSSEFGFEELETDKLPSSCLGLTIKDLEIRRKTGTNIIGHKKKNGEYVVNPDPETKFEEGTSFIVLGTKVQLVNLFKYLESINHH